MPVFRRCLAAAVTASVVSTPVSGQTPNVLPAGPVAAPARADVRPSLQPDSGRAQAATPGGDEARTSPSPLRGYVFAGGGPYVRQHWIEDLGGGSGRIVAERGSMPAVGGAVEWQPLASLAASVEAGVVAYGRYPGGTLALNLSVYPGGERLASRAVVPFVTGGYSLISDRAPRLNLGGGLDYRFAAGLGLRGELRHHLAPRWTPPASAFTSLLQFRMALQFALSRGQDGPRPDLRRDAGAPSGSAASPTAVVRHRTETS